MRHGARDIGESSVEESFTGCCTAEAGDTICAPDFTLEFVVVGEFLVCEVLAMGWDHETQSGNLLCAISRSA